MLFGSMKMNLQELRRLFVSIAEGQACQLHTMKFVTPVDDIRIALFCVDTLHGGLYRAKDGEHSYTWTQSSEEWLHIVDLLDALIEYQIPCHQYLTHYPNDDATVVVSKGEYADRDYESQ